MNSTHIKTPQSNNLQISDRRPFNNSSQLIHISKDLKSNEHFCMRLSMRYKLIQWYFLSISVRMQILIVGTMENISMVSPLGGLLSALSRIEGGARKFARNKTKQLRQRHKRWSFK